MRGPRSVRALTALGLLLPLLVTPVLAEDLPNLELQTTINVTAEPGESCEVAWTKRGTYTLPPGELDISGFTLPTPPGALKPFPPGSTVSREGDQCVIKVFVAKRKQWCDPGDKLCVPPPGEY
ncbi:hypothetical protein [Lichenifustis flavocetrariae]|uniref:Ig-like domain-containing protein n=1 Tax=Lichenifustis flavocetrariae TaxID=2949735 RepID=A0AA42CMR4_9HYPH|nr:hypothetical protein [Lichenifustis flavocetrariae]MCW6511866.1 hypothetical protein [Lichenifustis flavocetrariae]